MTNDKRAAMLIKVRAMLAKAESTDHPGEADVFRAKAQELMDKYMIEMADLQTAESNVIGAHDMSFSWYKGEWSGSLWMMFLDIARHCRVKVVNWKPNYSDWTIPVVGL